MEVATSAAAIESVAAHAQASPAPEPAAEDGSASASASSQTESAAAAEVSSQPVQSSIAAAAAPRVDTVSSAGTVSAEQAPAAAEAVSAAKPLPEQDKPVPLTPRSPGTDTGGPSRSAKLHHVHVLRTTIDGALLDGRTAGMGLVALLMHGLFTGWPLCDSGVHFIQSGWQGLSVETSGCAWLYF